MGHRNSQDLSNAALEGQIARDGGFKLGCGCFVPLQVDVVRDLHALHGLSAVEELMIAAVADHPCTRLGGT